MVWSGFQTAVDRGIGSEVLLLGTQATVLDRRPSLDDAGDRRGPTIGRLLEGIPHERARCLSGVPIIRDTPDGWACEGAILVSRLTWQHLIRSPRLYEAQRRADLRAPDVSFVKRSFRW